MAEQVATVTSEDLLLRMTGISKSFPGVRALDDVHLDVHRATVHALMGENGAGKSTLMKVLAGIYRADSGSIEFNGREVTIPDTATALRIGISMIHQELSPVPHMTVAENIFLGRQPRNRFRLIDRGRMVSRGEGSPGPLEDRPGPQLDHEDVERRPDPDGRDRQGHLLRLAAHHHGRADIGHHRA